MAAGTSQRCGFDKLLAELKAKTVLQTTVDTFQASRKVNDIWIVGKTKVPLKGDKIKGFILGGKTRFQSVQAGIEACLNQYSKPENIRLVVHNAANPFLTLYDLKTGLEAAKTKPNLVFGFFTPNAIKQVNKNGIVNKFLDREQIFETQTPQIAPLNTFVKALKIWNQISLKPKNNLPKNIPQNHEPHDEAELLALTGTAIYVYECSPSNTKITYPSDFNRDFQSECRVGFQSKIQLGIGEDSHRFAKNFDPQKPFRLGGIDLSYNQLSSNGNSDGDIILHALCNALLSAFGDKTFDSISGPICAKGDTNSVSYLKATLKHLEAAGHKFQINQILISLEGAQPKITPFHEAVVNHLAKLLNLEPSRIGLTYTTGETLTSFGKGEGMRGSVLLNLTV